MGLSLVPAWFDLDYVLLAEYHRSDTVILFIALYQMEDDFNFPITNNIYSDHMNNVLSSRLLELWSYYFSFGNS